MANRNVPSGRGMEGAPRRSRAGGFGPEGGYGGFDEHGRRIARPTDVIGQVGGDRERGRLAREAADLGRPRDGRVFTTGSRADVSTARDHAGRGPRNWRRADSRIHEDVCEALTWHPALDASGMEVTVENGEVTLAGTAPDRRTKRLAEDVADSVSGVRDVHNRLTVDR